MKKSVEEFIYPNEILREKLPYLEELYSEDYGEDYVFIIRDRMKSTLYVFDSDPVVTMNFVRNKGNDISDGDFLKRVEKEYKNYIRVKDIIHAKQKRKYYSKLASYFSLLPYPVREDILALDIEAYSYSNVYKVKSLNDEKAKERQEEYCRQCSKLGVRPITNSAFIHMILSEKEHLDLQEKKLLLKNTRWGRRIIKVMKKYYPKISLDDIVSLMGKDYVAYTAYLLGEDGISNARIMYYPLLKNLNLKDLDGIFYHENRHIIESTSIASGLHAHRGNYYRLLNEIRTEKNAILDKEWFNKDFLWSTDEVPIHYYNLYVQLFPYVATFFEDNREFLNGCAIKSDFSSLENRFGVKNLMEFEQLLVELAKELKKSHINGIDDEKREKGNTLIKKMQ